MGRTLSFDPDFIVKQDKADELHTMVWMIVGSVTPTQWGELGCRTKEKNPQRSLIPLCYFWKQKTDWE